MLKFKKGFVEWEEYKHRIDFMNDFLWQQSVRKANLGKT